MNADDARREAERMLATRLRAWGVENHMQRARDYVADLSLAGWQWMPAANRPRPPKPHEACRDCGRHFDACACDGGPTIRPVVPAPDPAVKVARLRAVVDETRSELCAHGTPRRNCLEHRTATTEETR